MTWRWLAETRIEAAVQAGDFDDLPGSGRPLRLIEDEGLDTGQWAAFHLLQNAGLAPEWIELDRELRRQLAAAGSALRRQGDTKPARERFARRLAEINRLVDRLNLLVPAMSLQRPHYDLAREARRALASPGNQEPA